jgi:hypothetical protein
MVVWEMWLFICMVWEWCVCAGCGQMVNGWWMGAMPGEATVYWAKGRLSPLEVELGMEKPSRGMYVLGRYGRQWLLYKRGDVIRKLCLVAWDKYL